MNRRSFYFLTLFLGLSLVSPAWGVIVDRIVAVVNNEVVTLSELQNLKHSLLKETATPDKSDGLTQDKAELEKKLLNELIDKKLQLQQARQRKIQVAEDQIQAAVQDLMRQNNITTPEQLEKALAEEGTSLEQLKKQIEENIKLSRLISLEVRSKILIAEDDIAEYYHKHEAEFKQEELSARHILFPLFPEAGDQEIGEAKELACQSQDKLWQGQENGFDFDKLVNELERKYSIKSGDLGYFGKGQVLPEIDQAIWGLPVGQTAIVRTDFGIHLVQVTDRRLHALDNDSQIKERVKQAIYRQKLQQKMDAWLADLHKKASIKVML